MEAPIPPSPEGDGLLGDFLMKMPSIKAGNFVRRQTPESQWAHYDGSWDEVVDLVKFNWDRRRHGYRDGVVLVPVPPRGFYTPIIWVDESTRLDVHFGSRRSHEEKHISVSALGSKREARRVDVVLYRADVLEEGDERETDADWEIVSVNACPSEDEAPMKPITMARNFLVKDGGTEGNYTAKQFAEAIWFWSQHANVREPDEADSTCPLCVSKHKTVPCEASKLLEQTKQGKKKEYGDVADS